MIYLSLFFFLLAGASRGLAELLGFKHSQSVFSAKSDPTSFFGSKAWLRKYNYNRITMSPREAALKNWYYKFNDIEYRERFWLSATALVWLTDGFHFFNVVMKVCLVCAIVTFRQDVHPAFVILYFVAWSAGFTLTHNIIFQKRSLK